MKSNDRPPNLKELGKRLKSVDMLVVALLKRRMDLALQVGESKLLDGQKIFRESVESERLEQVRKEAVRVGLSPHFAASMLYQAINESCKQQMIQLQDIDGRTNKTQLTPDMEYALLKQNLLQLTAAWAPVYDASYDEAFFATHAYLEFENELLQREIGTLSPGGILVDLGCATGRIAVKLAGLFDRVVGYEISPHMIEVARAREGLPENVLFVEADIEQGIAQPDNSVSFVVMNMGTASDVRDIESVLKETERVLKVGGKFFFSFYNHDALLYQWDFIPWPVGLAAEINLHKHCLDVHVGAEVLSVYARPYTVDEVIKLFPPSLGLFDPLTHPTIGAVLPQTLFEGRLAVQQSVTDIDKLLAESRDGAYIIVMGQKK